MKVKLSEREVLIAASTGVTAAAAFRFGVIARLPAAGPVSQPMVAIGLGIALSSFIDGGGTGGDIIQGIGYGLIAAGAIGLGQ